MPPSARNAAARSPGSVEVGDVVGEVVDEMPFTDTDTVSTPPGPLGPSIVSVDSVRTSPSRGLVLPPVLDSHVMGVRRAPPRLSSEPRSCVEGLELGVLQEMERGSLPRLVSDVPLERTVREDGSGIAGGRGKTCAPDVTCTTLSKACR